MRTFTPRQLLKACDDHRQRCLAAGQVLVCQSFDTASPAAVERPPPTGLDDVFSRELRAAVIDGLLDQKNENQLRDLITEVLNIYAGHLEPPDDVDVVVQPDPDQRRPSLHGRLTFIFRSEADRALQGEHGVSRGPGPQVRAWHDLRHASAERYRQQDRLQLYNSFLWSD